MPVAVLLPLVTASAFAAAALRAAQSVPLGAWNEAYPHVPGHLVAAGAALLAASSSWTLRERALRRPARRAALALSCGWAVVALASATEALGARLGNGTEDHPVHLAGVLLLGPAAALVLAGSAAVVVAPGSLLSWPVRLSLALTLPAWLGLGAAGSGTDLLLGLGAATAWLLVAATTHAATLPRPGPPAARGAWAAIGAGLLWIPYGALELVQPFGPDTRYDGSAGYDVVVDASRFVGYSLPGAVALVLSGLALVALSRSLPGRQRGGRAAGAAAAALGAVSGFGVLAQVDPLFTGPRVVGTLLLGAGLLAAAVGAPAPWRLLLAVLGGVGLLLLPLWPLVYAVQWLPAGIAAGVFVLHGAGWTALGLCWPALSPSVRPRLAAPAALVPADAAPGRRRP